MARRDLWTYPTVADRPDIVGGDVVAFDAEASDGHVGTVIDATDEVGASFVVVDTGRKKVMIPAGVIERIDAGGARVFFGLTKDQIENAPDFDEVRAREASYREEMGGYYSSRLDFGASEAGRGDRPRGVVG
jgi:hypothetical protein